MKSAVKCVVGGMCLLALVAPAVAQGFRTTVIGFPPYTLGMPMADALKRDPTLLPESRTCSRRVSTVDYGATVTAPIAGDTHTADIVLCFYHGQLGMITLRWPSTEFPTGSDWRSSVQALAREVARSYAPPLIEVNFDNGEGGALVKIADTRGNTLTMKSGMGQFDISIAYVWAPYHVAVDNAPMTMSSY